MLCKALKSLTQLEELITHPHAQTTVSVCKIFNSTQTTFNESL